MSSEHARPVLKPFVWQYYMNEKKIRKNFSQNSDGLKNVTFFHRILADFHEKIDFFQDFRNEMKILKADLKSASKISLTIREGFFMNNIF